MTTIVTRAGKGSPLTHTEVDTNFTNLNTNKLETAAIPLGTAAAPSISFVSDANTGIFSPGADQVAISSNGTSRLHITSAGLVGIGDSGPDARLTVKSSGASTTPLNVKNSNGTEIFRVLQTAGGGSQTSFKDSSGNTNIFIDGAAGQVGIGTGSPLVPLHVETTTDGPQTLAYLSNLSTGGTNETAALAFALRGTAGTGICRISAGKDSDFSTNANIDSHLAFTTTLDDTEGERLRITSGGLVGIGTSSPVGKVMIIGADTTTFGTITNSALNLGTVNGTASGRFVNLNFGYDNSATNAPAAIGFLYTSGAGNGLGSLCFGTRNVTTDTAPTERMRIDSAGTITFSAYGAGTLSTSASGVISASDGRYKTKTRQLESGLDAIAALEPTYYRWNEGSPFESEYEELGFVAQEVAAVIPEASPGEDEEGKYRNYHDRAIIAMLVKGMQEQQSIITALTARVAALEAQ